MANYQNEILRKLWEVANNRKNTELGIPLRSIEGIDVSILNVGPLSYNINLSSAGQGAVKGITMGVKAIGVFAAIAGTMALAAPAAAAAGTVGSSAAGAVGSAAVSGATGGVAGAVVSGAKMTRMVRVMSMVKMATNTVNVVNSKQFKDNVQGVQNFSNQIGSMVGVPQDKGFVENIVGSITDSSLGKPQRRKIINDYLESSLIPEFTNRIGELTNLALQHTKTCLNDEAQNKISQLEDKLKELKDIYASDTEKFKERMAEYRKFAEILNN